MDEFSATVYSSTWCTDNPGHGTKIYEREKGTLLFVDLQILQSWCHDYPGHGTKILQEEEVILSLLVYLQSGATRDPGHSTKIYERGRMVLLFIIVPVNSQLSPTLQPGAMRNPSTIN